MLGGLPRKDQRAAGELYARGLLTDGPRKSMQPMAARLGTDHQRRQQFITSSTWDYAAVRRNVAPWHRPSAAERPKSPCAGMTLYQVLRELQLVLAVIPGTCPLCSQPVTIRGLEAALSRT